MNNYFGSDLHALVSIYEELTLDKSTFEDSLPDIVETALDIMLELANKAEMPVLPVELWIESLKKQASVEKEVGDLGVTIAKERIFTFIDKKPIKAYIVYVDFTSSTRYFIPANTGFRYRENYTGFVIFNAFMMLFKSYLRLYLEDYGGEFIEHTGDGFSFIIKNVEKLEVHLTGLIYISEVLREKAEEYGLLHIGRDTMSLIHIGLSYGKGRRVIISGEKKFVSPATWLAAKACQYAGRKYDPFNPFRKGIINHNILFESFWVPGTNSTSDIILGFNNLGRLEIILPRDDERIILPVKRPSIRRF